VRPKRLLEWGGHFSFSPFGGLRWTIPKLEKTLKHFAEVGVRGSFKYVFGSGEWVVSGAVYGRVAWELPPMFPRHVRRHEYKVSFPFREAQLPMF